MRKAVAALFVSGFVAVVTLSCSTTDYDRPMGSGRGQGSRGDGRWSGGGQASSDGTDLMLPPGWWHDSDVAAPVNLTPEQLAALDRIGSGDSDEIAKLVRDGLVAMRQLRDVLDSEKPTEEAILAAAQHVRELRDAAFDRQVRLVAAQRQILTRVQWQALEEQLQAERRPRNRSNDGGRGGRGGRGGFGGRGRRPGGF